MKSALAGKNISEVEVTNVSQHRFWLLINDRELFLPFEKFPWFRDVPIGHLLRVEQPHATHLYWPDLDVDLAVESIEFPERRSSACCLRIISETHGVTAIAVDPAISIPGRCI
jgi:hypothetical protein